MLQDSNCLEVAQDNHLHGNLAGEMFLNTTDVNTPGNLTIFTFPQVIRQKLIKLRVRNPVMKKGKSCTVTLKVCWVKKI